MITFKPIASSNLLEGGYDPETQKCQVRFKNGLYEYSGVTLEIWAQFEATFQSEASSGKFFQAYIKPLPYKKIG